MRISWFVVLGLFSLLLGGAGCSASVTVDTCSTDSTISCSAGTGYSCTGSAVPDAAAGNCMGDGTGLYCCSAGATIVITTGCSADSTVSGCSSPSTGYSCTGTVPPDAMDPTLSCSIGVVDPTVAADLVYCCLTGETFKAGTCGQDDGITSICTTPGSYGFKCAAMDTPDQTDATLTCSSGVPDADGSSTDFCCTAGGATTTIVITSTCSADASVTGCASPSAGYSCTASDPPDSMDPTLICSVGVPSGGDTTYCCLSGETFAAGTCQQDLTVASCVGGSYGFSCAGTDTPDQTDATLTCSIGVTSGSDTLFCCLSSQYAWAAGTCGPDDTITTCQPGSFGFKCAASDTPDQTDATLVCSTGVADADGTSTDFCCTD